MAVFLVCHQERGPSHGYCRALVHSSELEAAELDDMGGRRWLACPGNRAAHNRARVACRYRHARGLACSEGVDLPTGVDGLCGRTLVCGRRHIDLEAAKIDAVGGRRLLDCPCPAGPNLERACHYRHAW